MKWFSNLDNKCVLPILFGVSLMTFGISVGFLFYPIFEKDDETKNDNTKTYRQIITSRYTTVQYKVPKQFISAIIGRGGSMIQNIQNKTGTYIVMTSDTDSSDSFCLIKGNDIEGIRLAESMIKHIIDSQSVIETYELLMPHAVCKNSGILSRDTIQQIQRSSGAKLIMEKGAYIFETGQDRKIIIKGTVKQIELAVIQIDHKIKEKEKEAQTQAQLKYQQKVTPKALSLPPSENSVENIMNVEPIKTCKFSLSYEACEIIIGTSGNIIQQIRKFSGAEVIIERSYNLTKTRSITIKGTANQITLAMIQIKNIIQEENRKIDLRDDLTVIKKMGTFELSPSLLNAVNMFYHIEESTEASLPRFLLQDYPMQIYVTGALTPDAFWIHILGPWIGAWNNLMFLMDEYYNKVENRKFHVLREVTPSLIVAAKHSTGWSRAEVMVVIEDQCEVYFGDYGTSETFHVNEVFELRTDMLNLRFPMAIECSLINIEPRGEDWELPVCQQFAKLVHAGMWKCLFATVRGYKKRLMGSLGMRSHFESSLIPCIELYDEDIDIRETLIRLELAQPEKTVHSTEDSTLLQDKRDLPSDSASPLTEHVSND